MNYELAKELKDVGFPQRPTEFGWVFLEVEGQDEPDEVWGTIKFPTIETRSPVLGELIEACGEGFERLIRIKAGVGGVVFQAQGGFENYEVAQYRTPEEAVARLWLALNKKS